jgi:hypothetical protein
MKQRNCAPERERYPSRKAEDRSLTLSQQKSKGGIERCPPAPACRGACRGPIPNGNHTLPFVIPTGAKRSGGICSSLNPKTMFFYYSRTIVPLLLPHCVTGSIPQPQSRKGRPESSTGRSPG